MNFNDSLFARMEPFMEICNMFPKGDRAPELGHKQEKEIELIYNEWRGSRHVIAGCDDCIEEALERLFSEATAYGKNT